MATILNDVTGVFHTIRVKRYPNYLKHKIPGKYLARTDSEATVTIEMYHFQFPAGARRFVAKR